MCLFFKQMTAYDMRISDWSSDVCSSDLSTGPLPFESRGFGHAQEASQLLGRPRPALLRRVLGAVWVHQPVYRHRAELRHGARLGAARPQHGEAVGAAP